MKSKNLSRYSKIITSGFAAFLLGVAGLVQAADQEWSASFDSQSLKRKITVSIWDQGGQLNKLGFGEPAQCQLALAKTSQDGVYDLRSMPDNQASGPFCGNALGGQLHVKPNEQFRSITVVDSKNRTILNVKNLTQKN